MAAPPGEIFEFGDFTLDPTDRLLLLRGQPLRLTPKTFDLLVALVRHRGSLMTKDRLLDMIWPEVFVAEINLSVNISTLRKLLMRSRGRPTFIETVPTHGYRFVAPVKSKAARRAILAPGSLDPTSAHKPSKTRAEPVCKVAITGTGGQPRAWIGRSSIIGAPLLSTPISRRRMRVLRMLTPQKGT